MERFTKKVDGVWTALCNYGSSPYHRSLSDCSKGVPGCHYCLDTGNPRGCPIDKCDKKELGKCDARTNPFDARLGRAYE